MPAAEPPLTSVTVTFSSVVTCARVVTSRWRRDDDETVPKRRTVVAFERGDGDLTQGDTAEWRRLWVVRRGEPTRVAAPDIATVAANIARVVVHVRVSSVNGLSNTYRLQMHVGWFCLLTSSFSARKLSPFIGRDEKRRGRERTTSCSGSI